MKKFYLTIALISIIGVSNAQKFDVPTADQFVQFKRHYSYSIEGGFVNSQPRNFVAGNVTDWMANSDEIRGNSINGTTMIGRRVTIGSDETILLTDFVVQPGSSYQYAYGTGIYFPGDITGMAYPFLGVYDKATMGIIALYYYDLSYPADVPVKNAAGTRIKYSAREGAFYISGIMVDDAFVDLNFYDIRGNSKGFIMKIDETSMNLANVLAFNPSNMPPETPEICSVNDMEIDADEQYIYFTGVTTEEHFTKYYHPMAGKIDMDLNYQWCNVYEVQDERFSGVDVEFGFKQQDLFILMNSDKRPFSIMQLGLDGSVIQQPEKYFFSINRPGSLNPLDGLAHGYRLHYTSGDGLIVTGNNFIEDALGRYQDLFTYEIPVASNLGSGNNYFNSYLFNTVPIGSQIPVTSWWSTEISLLKDGNLFLIGNYDKFVIPVEHGYSYIIVSGFDTSDPDCFRQGDVVLDHTVTQFATKTTTDMHCERFNIIYIDPNWTPVPDQSCPEPQGKSSLFEEIENSQNAWTYLGMDETGVYFSLNAEELSDYRINVYDITGRIIRSEAYSVKGLKSVSLKFKTQNQMYLINISTGSNSETIKVFGN